MTLTNPQGAESYVRALLDGRVDYSPLEPYPTLSHGRVKQVGELFKRLRREETLSGIPLLKKWNLLDQSREWPAPLLARVIRQVGAVDASAALSAIAHLALGVRLIDTWGTEAQLRQFETTEDSLCAFALTEETPGSDISRIQTYAEPTEDGFCLTGTKHWVTNAESATHFVVIARTAPPRAADKPRLTAFLVKSQAAIKICRVESDVLVGAGVAQVTFDGVRLRREDVLGTVGKGFRVVMDGLSEARLFVGAAVLGACVRSFNDTVARVSSRRAFGRAVGKFPSVQHRISGMLSEILAMESLVHGISGLAEPGAVADPVERGVVRLAVSRGSARVLDFARELHGAAAFAGNMRSARHWADTRALVLLDGSDLALESYIVLEGTREIRHRMARLRDTSDVLTRVDAAASIFVGKARSRLRRATAKEVPGLAMDELYEFTERLGAAVDAAVRKHGVELVEKQHIQSRLASLTVELSTWCALAARVQHEIEKSTEVGSRRMIEVAAVWVQAARLRVESLLQELQGNDDNERDQVAQRAFIDKAYPFDVI